MTHLDRGASSSSLGSEVLGGPAGDTGGFGGLTMGPGSYRSMSLETDL